MNIFLRLRLKFIKNKETKIRPANFKIPNHIGKRKEFVTFNIFLNRYYILILSLKNYFK